MAKTIMAVSIDRVNKTKAMHVASINVPKKAKIIDVQVFYGNDTQVLFEVDADEMVFEERIFLALKMGEIIPEQEKLNYLGTSVVQGGHVIEQIFEIITKKK